jgi:molybdate transport system regulatory protein
MARVSIRLVFDPAGAIGPGKIALLHAIQATGSIAQAAKQHKMSYARAWKLIDEMNHLFPQRLVTTAAGGRKGGGASLTAFGTEVLALFERVAADCNRRFERELEHLQQAADAASPEPAPEPQA